MKIEDTTLFGKYQICRVLGTGRTGTVFLTVHMGLEEYRAVKRVAKRDIDYERFRREALILKECRHPGIPVVYDLEEDENYSYLIEEYLEGESLYDLVNRLGHLSGAKLIRYGIQISSIVNHLHSAGNYPILYLDLQPKNLLVCQETIKLIDFDHAASVTEANRARRRYGTAGCAAPEQYTDEPLDERTDIYAIGVILYYLGTGTYPEPDPEFPEYFHNHKLAVIIRRCLNREKAGRYGSAAEVKEDLERLEQGKQGVFKKNQSSSLKIALTGSKSGVGTTHLAIGLSVYLNRHGFSNLYEERNQTGAVRAWMAYHQIQAGMNGLINIKNCVMKPFYGENVKLDDPVYPIILCDYGTDWSAVRDDGPADLTLLACGGKWWEAASCLNAVRALNDRNNLCLVFLPGSREAGVRYPEEIRNKTCFQMPFYPNPFILDSQTEAFYKALLQEVGKEKGGVLRRKPGRRLLALLRRAARL